jgi:hypothetical protein
MHLDHNQTRVGRTLLSVAFDFEVDFDLARAERTGTLARLLLILIGKGTTFSRADFRP